MEIWYDGQYRIGVVAGHGNFKGRFFDVNKDRISGSGFDTSENPSTTMHFTAEMPYTLTDGPLDPAKIEMFAYDNGASGNERVPNTGMAQCQ